MSGKLGRIISAEFHEYLDVQHGASYFRRWHGKKRFLGSLLVHKASHHFDQMNWWLEAEPTVVHAFGGVRGSTAETARSAPGGAGAAPSATGASSTGTSPRVGGRWSSTWPASRRTGTPRRLCVGQRHRHLRLDDGGGALRPALC